MRRDLERERERVEAAEAAVRRGRITELDGEPVEAIREQGPATIAAPDGDEALAAARAEADKRAEGEDGTRGDPDDETEIFERPRRRGGHRGRRGANGSEDETEMLERPPRRGGHRGRHAESGPSPSPATPARRSACSARAARGAPARGPPRTPRPGTAAIGARHIEPGQTPQRSSAAAWSPGPWPSRRWPS